jgi:hypothetical protein
VTVQSKALALSYAADESDVYRTFANTYDVRDQVVETQSHADGVEADPSKIQKTVATYDGHGRVESRHVPEQQPDKFTLYTYYADDMVATAKDERDAVSTYHYNGRHLVVDVTHDGAVAGVQSVSINYNYDEAGRVREVTNTGYANARNVSAYATGMAYRACALAARPRGYIFQNRWPSFRMPATRTRRRKHLSRSILHRARGAAHQVQGRRG